MVLEDFFRLRRPNRSQNPTFYHSINFEFFEPESKTSNVTCKGQIPLKNRNFSPGLAAK